MRGRMNQAIPFLRQLSFAEGVAISRTGDVPRSESVVNGG